MGKGAFTRPLFLQNYMELQNYGANECKKCGSVQTATFSFVQTSVDLFLRKGTLSIGRVWSRDQKFLQNYGSTENEYVQTYSEKST